MAHILVTGAAGFIGLAVTRALVARGDRVSALDVEIGPALAALAARHRSVRALAGEIADGAAVAALVGADPPDGVIHCAAIVGVIHSVRAPARTMRVNVEGSINLLEAMRLHGVWRMVHISSEEVYGAFRGPVADEDHPQSPVGPYGVSKLAVEHLARFYRARHGITTAHLRTSWVYGPGLPRARVPKIFIDAALDGRPLHLAAGAELAVDHTYIDDAVDGVLRALDLPVHPFDAYNIGSGAAPRLDEMAAIVCDLVPGAELTVGPGPYDHGSVEGVPIPSVPKGALDLRRAREVLGYVPRFDIRRGLADYIARERAARSG
ncbi:MAG: NAD(P)-dependent oxidoreductase [Rhodospirillales bacterium]|nr:NAD(P)-dependent oxidoreductase [Rhodospirillales bacterium]MDE2198006.1 NAD(P)-dependent oxidoreductase [Rhodospirillales bacterium]MDE2574568.1 NAD(P)-dependent oxidoreductase [Rhodospirillales bacterium]